MPALDAKKLHDKAKFVIHYLKLRGINSITLADLIKRVEQIERKKIKLVAAPLRDIYTGLSFLASDGNYYIYYNNDLIGRTKLIVILHELAHIHLAEVDKFKPHDPEKVFNIACGFLTEADLELSDLVCLCQSEQGAKTSQEDFEAELAVQYVASQLLQKLVLDDEWLLMNNYQYWGNITE